MNWFFDWLRRLFAILRGGSVPFVGIATVIGQPGFRAPLYPWPRARGLPVAFLAPGQYVPHFAATGDGAWLEVTLHSGDRAWLQNDPAHVDVTRPDPDRVRLCIDPGHGGTDGGAAGNGIVEKNINLDIAYNRLGSRLLADARIDRVWFTRTGDQDVSLAYRADLANAAGATLFVSVHNNAHLASSQGTETYYKCGTEGTAAVRDQSRRAACLVHQRLREQILRWGSVACPWVDRGVICRLLSQADQRSYYYVLRNTGVPAVLVECLFVSNPDEAACLAHATMRDFLAQGLYAGITDALFTTAPGMACNFKTFYGL